MYCNNCRTFNSDGRETCTNCGKDLLDIHGIIAQDRWVGMALRIVGWGCLAGGIAGVLIGGGLGIWLSASDAMGGAIGGAFGGVYVGVPCGGIIGGAIGVYKYAPRSRS